MRRIPREVWIFLPLLAALAYSGLYGAFEAEPDLVNVAPENAIHVQRFRGLDALDASWLGPRDPQYAPSDLLGARRNLAGLPGVDRRGWFHRILVPRADRADPSILVFPIADADTIRARFEDPDFYLDHGQIRHAQFLAIHGDFAAVSGDRESVRHLGENGLSIEARDEDHALAIRVPEMIQFALRSPLDPPWRDLLLALGMDPAGAKRARPRDAPGGEALWVPAGRVLRLHQAWKTARAWFWNTGGRVRAELEPQPGPLANLLHSITAERTVPDSRLPIGLAGADAWVRTPGPRETAALFWILYGAGVPFPDSVTASLPTERAPGLDWGRDLENATGGLVAWAISASAGGHAWTLGFAAGDGLPDLTPFSALIPKEEGTTAFPEGALPFTVADPASTEPAPAGRVVRRRLLDLDILTMGTAAEQAQVRFEAQVDLARPAAPVDIVESETGFVPIATFRLSARRANQILGPALETGGLLWALREGAIEGTLSTDGRVLILEVRAERTE